MKAKTKMLTVGLFLGITILVVGLILPIQSLQFDETFGDSNAQVRVFGFAELLNPSGQAVSENLLQNAFVIEGDEVQFLAVTVNWTASGNELNWDTFQITFNRKLTIVDKFQSVQPYIIAYPVSTSIFRAGTLKWTEDIRSAIMGHFSPEALTLFTGVRCTYTIDATASIKDIYGTSIIKTGTVIVAFTLDWKNPDLTFQFGTESTTISGATVGGAIGTFSLLFLGALILSVTALYWRKHK